MLLVGVLVLVLVQAQTLTPMPPAWPLLPHSRSNAVRDSSAPARRSLERNSRVSIAMLAIAVTYSLLIITFYSVGYILTLTTAQNVAIVAVAQRNMERTCKAVFSSQVRREDG